MHSNTPQWKSGTPESSVPGYRHKRISHPWLWKNTTDSLHILNKDNLPKLTQPSKVHAHLKAIMAKVLKQKETGRMDQDLRKL